MRTGGLGVAAIAGAMASRKGSATAAPMPCRKVLRARALRSIGVIGPGLLLDRRQTRNASATILLLKNHEITWPPVHADEKEVTYRSMPARKMCCGADFQSAARF